MARKLVCSAVLIAIGALALPSMSSATGYSSYSKYDWVLGHGEIASPNGQPNNTFALGAIGLSSPFGFGNYSVTDVGGPGICDPGCSFTVKITCMRVVGKRATLVGPFIQEENQPERFDGAVIYVEDNGFTKWGKPPVDRQQNRRLEAAELAALRNNCPAPITPPNTIVKGEIVVRDAY